MSLTTPLTDDERALMTTVLAEYTSAPLTVAREQLRQAAANLKHAHDVLAQAEAVHLAAERLLYEECVLIQEAEVARTDARQFGLPMPPPAPPRIRRQHVPGCVYCDRYRPDGFFPPHDASARCESGQREHCTCDVCW
jgi:hypothetical protein